MIDLKDSTFCAGINVGKERYPFQRYIVIFLDMLGQGQLMLDLQSKFTNLYMFDDKDNSNFLTLPEDSFKEFEKCFSPVYSFRERLCGYIEQAKENLILKHRHLEGLTIPINIESSSDNIWVWAPLANSESSSEMMTLCSLLCALSIGYISSVADGVMFRGGVTISYGFEMRSYVNEGTNYFGPGLAQAAQLEKKAFFPRIVADDNVINLIKCHIQMGQTSSDDAWKSSGKMAEYCANFLSPYKSKHMKDAEKLNTLVPPVDYDQIRDALVDAIKIADREMQISRKPEIKNKYKDLYDFLRSLNSYCE